MQFQKDDLVTYKGTNANVQYIYGDGSCRILIDSKNLIVNESELTLVPRNIYTNFESAGYSPLPTISPSHESNYAEESIDGIRYFRIPISSPMWRYGFVLGKYTYPSGKHTDVGDLINRFKYHKDMDAGATLANLMAAVIQKHLTVLKTIDYIVPVPPSNTSREVQPVKFLADNIGKKLGLPVSFNLKKLRSTEMLKNYESKEQKAQALKGAFTLVNTNAYNEKRLLVIDDVYTHGATLEEVCRTLNNLGHSSGVYCVVGAKTGT